MEKRRNLTVGLLGALALIVLNGLAYRYFWYWHYRWADMPMHVLGGITVGAFILFLTNNKVSFLRIVGLSFLVALVWELFEFKFQSFLPISIALKTLPVWERSPADTVSDIFCGVLGTVLIFGLLAYRQAAGNRVSLDSYDRTKEDQA